MSRRANRRRSMLETDELQPNKSSCGNQTANVSLTLQSRKDSPPRVTTTGRHTMSGLRTQKPGGRSSMPHDNWTYI